MYLGSGHTHLKQTMFCLRVSLESSQILIKEKKERQNIKFLKFYYALINLRNNLTSLANHDSLKSVMLSKNVSHLAMNYSLVSHFDRCLKDSLHLGFFHSMNEISRLT